MANSVLETAERQVPAHKRTYQACIPCRRRKVRCDLGSVDNPHDPPCVRCRREKKDCFFSETRRKRKADDEGGRSIDDLDDDYLLRNRRSQTARNGSLPDGDAGSQTTGKAPQVYVKYSDALSIGDQNDLNGDLSSYPRPSRPSPSDQASNTPEGQEVTNETAAALFQSPIQTPGDALYLLFEAAGRTGDLDRHSKKEDSIVSPGHERHIAPPKQTNYLSPGARGSLIDPAIATYSSGVKAIENGDFGEALQAWSRLRFVRAGWLTAREAISYIDYFYEHLAPLTPISTPDFRSPSSHAQLLNEEPVLAVTLLTIAARYKQLAGPGGQSRSYVIHEKLWLFLQGMITRMFWGQEQFGGGFCGAGASTRGQGFGSNSGALRSLGTIESLLLLSDWHPRSMHFPPGDDDGEILAPLIANPLQVNSAAIPQSSPYAGWIEPAIRSDRMCWSLIGCAYTLAYEVGIFDSVVKGGEWQPQEGVSCQRENRLGRLLFIYLSQTAGRLGYPNMLPNQGRRFPLSYFQMLPPAKNADNSLPQARVLSNIQRAWAEITTLMKLSNDDLFASKALTREVIRSRRHLDLLRDYGPKLRDWLARFQSIKVPPHSRAVLMMEYEYARTYINSLALQAVLEECATAKDASAAPNSSGNILSPGGTPPALLSSKLVSLYKENEPYIAEVIDASRNLLRYVVDRLAPNDGLKHAPVRTNFRILSGAMFLLKTFAVGAKEQEVAISIQLLDDVVKALRTSVVDDVHLILRFADLLENLTSNIRNKFVRFAVPGKNAGKRANDTKNNSRRPPDMISDPLGGDFNRGRLQAPTTDSISFQTDYDSIQGPLAGISTNPIDPNDSSISIMPPPDFIYNTNPSTNNNNNIYTYPNPSQLQLSYPQPLSSPTQTYSNPQLPLPSPQAPFDPGYHWLTLDVNGLINNNYPSNQGNSNTPTNMWAGAFGPEISDNLEMLSMLTNEGYSFQQGDDGTGGWA